MRLGTVQSIRAPFARTVLVGNVMLTDASQLIGNAVPFNPALQLAALNSWGFITAQETGGVNDRTLLTRLEVTRVADGVTLFAGPDIEIQVGAGEAELRVWVPMRMVSFGSIADAAGNYEQVALGLHALQGAGLGAIQIVEGSCFVVMVEHY